MLNYYRFVTNENVLSFVDFSLGGRRNRCSILLQLSESNWVTLAVVELRVYLCCGRRLDCVDVAIFTENKGENQSVFIHEKYLRRRVFIHNLNVRKFSRRFTFTHFSRSRTKQKIHENILQRVFSISRNLSCSFYFPRKVNE